MCLEDNEISKDCERTEKILLKEEKGLSKKLDTIQPNFSTPKNNGINYKVIYQFVNTRR